MNAFGRDLDVILDGSCWRVFDLGGEGKRRPATDIQIPSDIDEQDVPQYLADLLHEYASTRHPDVTVIG